MLGAFTNRFRSEKISILTSQSIRYSAAVVCILMVTLTTVLNRRQVRVIRFRYFFVRRIDFAVQVPPRTIVRHPVSSTAVSRGRPDRTARCPLLAGLVGGGGASRPIDPSVYRRSRAIESRPALLLNDSRDDTA